MATSPSPTIYPDILNYLQSVKINKFRADPSNLWDIEHGALFIEKSNVHDCYHVAIYRHGTVMLSAVNILQLIYIGFDKFPLIFYFSDPDIQFIPFKSHQSIHHLPVPIPATFQANNELSILIQSFKTALFSSYPDNKKFGLVFTYAELFRARSSIPLFQFYLNHLQLPIAPPNPLTIPLVLNVTPSPTTPKTSPQGPTAEQPSRTLFNAFKAHQTTSSSAEDQGHFTLPPPPGITRTVNPPNTLDIPFHPSWTSFLDDPIEPTKL